MKAPRHRLWRRVFLWLGLLFLLIAAFVARPAIHIVRAIWDDRDEITATSPGTINDASRLSETPVAEIWTIPAERQAAETQLGELLQRARTKHLKVSIAGARHSMGAHTIANGGIVVDMLSFRQMELDAGRKILHVQAGARWHDVIRFLNARGLSVEIMQSNDDFTVGGSISVNCHGWQFARPPIASSVESFRLMLANGSVVKCSRRENLELFSLGLGGYGLFGIILDVELRVVPNERYQIERITVATDNYLVVFTNKTAGATNIGMIYGRLRVTADKFLSEGILNILRCKPGNEGLGSAFEPRKLATLKRAIFRGSVGSDYGKELRWQAEKNFGPRLLGNEFDRNTLLSDSATWFQNRRTNSTDILMECFVPLAKFEPFLEELRRIIPQNNADLLNLTVRHVNRDDDSFLRYADRDMFALVMLFNQTCDADGEARMQTTARQIITAALEHGGKYYLPYRLHATVEQFTQAYPQAKQFFELKRKYDPDELFDNGFYRSYGK